MDDVSTARIDTLRAQTRCPVCGAVARMHGGDPSDRVVALFACDAIFDVKNGLPLTVLKPCPRPSYVVIDALNREASSMAERTAA